MARALLHLWPLVLLGTWACTSSPVAPAPPPNAAPAAVPTPVSSLPPGPVVAPVEAPAVDLSGRWECLWNLPGGSGTETWMLMQEGQSIRVTLSGRDPGGRYTGLMNGTIAGRRMQLAFEYHDRTRGTMSLLVSANGRMIDGDSVRAVGGATSHYGCSRP